MRTDVETLQKLAFSIPEAVAATAISRSTLYAHIKTGQLKATKIGARTVILAADLRQWLASACGKAAGDE